MAQGRRQIPQQAFGVTWIEVTEIQAQEARRAQLSPSRGLEGLAERRETIGPRERGGQGQVGAPSLDLGPPPLLIVGSEPGVLYAVEVPFP